MLGYAKIRRDQELHNMYMINSTFLTSVNMSDIVHDVSVCATLELGGACEAR